MLKSKRMIPVFALLLAIVVFATVLFCTPKNVSAYAQINATIEEIEYQINASLEMDDRYTVNGMPLAFSSNPYDYVKDNSEFEKLVEMGMGAVDAIEDCLADTEKFPGLKGYVLAIALEEIYKVDLKQYKEYMWGDNESFIKSWEKVKNDVTTQVPAILRDQTLTDDEKYGEIAKFGLLAIKPLQQFSVQISSTKNEVDQTEAIATAQAIERILNSSSRDELVQAASGCYAQKSK